MLDSRTRVWSTFPQVIAPRDRAPTCPFSSLYRRCRKPGHIARECTQAWCPSVSAPATDTSYETSASSDRVMTDASPAVFVSASGSDPAAPVSITFIAPVSVPTAPVFLLLPFLSPPLLPLLTLPRPLFLSLPPRLPLLLKCLLSLLPMLISSLFSSFLAILK